MANETFPSGLTRYNGQNLLDWQQWLKDNEVLDQFITFIKNEIAPTGTIVPFSGKLDEKNDPPGWLFLTPKALGQPGRAVSRATYAKLFAAIGVTYGSGDGKTTFNLPNMAGRMPMGAGGTAALGATGGAATHTLTIAQMPSHYHREEGVNVFWKKDSRTYLAPGAGQSGAYGCVAPEGGGQPHNNMPPYIGMNFIIKT